jgi:predicted NAD/FAD-binding protein
MKKKLAVIGTGIAGMSAAYFLKDEYEITVFEKNAYIGGHTNTVFVEEDGKQIGIDTGFMVFNEITYPNLLKLFAKLDVPYKDTDMSFSVQHRPSGLEYNGTSLNALFAQRSNLFKPSYYKFLMQISRFNKEAPAILDDPSYEGMSIREYVKKEGFGEEFYNKFLVPMSSAVWSTPQDKMGDFPAQTLVRFFYNHGFMGLNTQYQWKTVIGGSESYKQKLIETFRDRIIVNSPIKSVHDNGDKVVVRTAADDFEFDRVVIAAHGDEAYAMLENKTPLQEELLSKFHYEKNIAVLHSQDSLMPKAPLAWAAWNYIIRNDGSSFTIYNMNILQEVSKKKHYLININGEDEVKDEHKIKEITYHHPLFDDAAVAAQKRLDELNDTNGNVFFCGSYFRYGFHEDALMSSVNLCSKILGKEVL